VSVVKRFKPFTRFVGGWSSHSSSETVQFKSALGVGVVTYASKTTRFKSVGILSSGWSSSYVIVVCQGERIIVTS